MRSPVALALLGAVAVVATALAFVAIRGGASGQPPATRVELQGVLDRLVTGPGMIAPGATAYVSGPLGTWVGSAGVADAAKRTPMSPDARMRLESVSKIWMAAVILRLAQDGMLRTEDTVERWLPGLLSYGSRLTIAQLLAHRSGLIDNNDMATDPARFIARVGEPGLRSRLTAAAERLRANPATRFSPLLWIQLAAWQPLLFTPGNAFHYSNIGYELLGLVAARASGRSVAELHRELVFEPFNLESVAYDPQGPITGPHARGYQVGKEGDLTDTTAWHGGVGAEGGLVANAGETARFLTGLMRGELLERRWLDGMKGDLFWSGGEASSCGTGYGHAGGGPGYSTQVRVSSTGDRVAVLLLNGRAGEAGDQRAARAIWWLYCAA